MGNQVFYKQKPLGMIILDENHKQVFVAESLKALEILLSLDGQEGFDVEGIGITAYKDFRDKHLKYVSVFYPSKEAFLLKDNKARTLDEFKK